jgi:ribosomal protein S11
MGAFIVRLPLAQEVGFKHYTYPAADGLYAEECAAKCLEKHLQAVHVNKVLFIHN